MTDPFLLLVTHMRLAQRAYFAERTPENLKKAKHLERLVDVAIDEESKPRAPSLFDRIAQDVEKF